MTDTMLFLYVNDNGVAVHELEDIGDDPAALYKQLVEKYSDDPFETEAYLVWWNDKWVAERVWSPDFDREMDFEEKNLGHPGHPHEYGDS